LSVRERLLALKLLEYQKKDPEFMEKIGVKVQMEKKRVFNKDKFLKTKLI
jgi:hypothetical protein